ncbi:hypothetical protein FACS1894166_01060 [Bacilli bacterium]|nr:hypothetical protein FACS1894166_01060 [Bacilli bacterium]
MFREGSGCLLAGSIPSTLLPNSISLYAFEGCASLTSINLSGVSFINDRAFPNCTQLQTIICPGLGFSLIDQVAFSGCAKLQSEIKIAAPIIDLEDPTKSTPSIGSSAFSGCATATTAGLQITFLGSIADYSLLNTIDNKSFSNLALKGTLTAGDENNETSKAA